nr:hypothetical protein [Nonlabens sp. Ci31]
MNHFLKNDSIDRVKTENIGVAYFKFSKLLKVAYRLPRIPK